MSFVALLLLFFFVNLDSFIKEGGQVRSDDYCRNVVPRRG